MESLQVFLSTLLLSFSAALILAGLFGAYYGRGRSRATGLLLSIMALLVGAFALTLTYPIVPGIPTAFDPDVVGASVLAVLAALLGFALAGFAFVAAVVRS